MPIGEFTPVTGPLGKAKRVTALAQSAELAGPEPFPYVVARGVYLRQANRLAVISRVPRL
jgi:hypothetical protein